MENLHWLDKKAYELVAMHAARLAQSVEHETLNLGVVGSSPTLGDVFCVQVLWLTSLNSTAKA